MPMTVTSAGALPTLLGNNTMTKNIPLQAGAPKATVNGAKPTQVATKAKENNKVVSQAVNESVKGEDDESNAGASVGIITAIGGTALGAAGVGLVFMKKKNPNQYEDLKQKFPEAFTQVKRNLTRSATQLKRKMTRRPAKPVTESTHKEISISTQ